MSAADDVFLRSLLKVLAKEGVKRVRPHIPSKTLQAALTVRLDQARSDRAYLYIPHYWAIYVHDGRGAPFGPPPSGKPFYIDFSNPKDDPRLAAHGGQTPPRVAQLRSLSSEEFKRFAKLSRAAKKAGAPPIMLVRPRIYKPTPGAFFFENVPGAPLGAFMAFVREEAQRRFRAHAIRRLRKPLGLQSVPRLNAVTSAPMNLPRLKDTARAIL